MTHYKSVFTNEQELLKAIIQIHLGGKDIELDPMYFKGKFYRYGVNEPRLKFDIKPQAAGVQQADARFLPVDGIESVILDPPFLFGLHGKAKEFYSSTTHGIFRDYKHLYEVYFGIIKEACRYLIPNGVLIFKCQDYTDNKTTMTHCVVKDIAERWGFYAKDIAILVKPNKVTNPNTKQRHLRKVHTYFWVFIKKGDFQTLDYC